LAGDHTHRPDAYHRHRAVEPGARVTAKASLVLALAVTTVVTGLASCTPSGPPAPVVTLDSSRPGEPLPVDYLGLSFEASVLGSARLDPSRSDLVNLLRDLGAGRLRFGGNSVDRVAAWVPSGAALPPWASHPVTPADLGQLGALSAATGWRIDLGLTLAHADPAAAASEAAAAARLIGPGLGTVEIGNEPDLYGTDRVLEPHGYTYADYQADVRRYRAAVSAAAPGVKVAGPDTAGPGWLRADGRDGGDGLSFLTQHFYPLTRCGGRRPSIGELLSPGTRQREIAAADAAVAAGRASGLGIRLDEVNSASCGGQDGVSNTLASALWIVDYLLVAGSRGVTGVDVHGGLAACRGYTPLCVRGATASVPGSGPGIDPTSDASLGAAAGQGPLAVQPDFYGLLLVHQLEGGRWLPAPRGLPRAITAFAVEMADGSIRLALDNPSPASTRLTIRAGGRRSIGGVLRLTGPALGATSGILLGGTSVAPDGTWRPPDEGRPAGGRPAGPSAQVSVDVGPASAVVVSLSASAPG
jgi:hypothetical protein